MKLGQQLEIFRSSIVIAAALFKRDDFTLYQEWNKLMINRQSYGSGAINNKFDSR